MPKPLESIIRLASGLSTEELQLLADATQGMLEARAGAGKLRVQDSAETTENRTLNPKTQRGSFERKSINNCGPYLYLRWWSGGKRRSTYLGKAP